MSNFNQNLFGFLRVFFWRQWSSIIFSSCIFRFKMKIYQLIETSGDKRMNLLLNVILLFSALPLASFFVYFILSTILIWSSALLIQCECVPSILFCIFLSFLVFALTMGFLILLPVLICTASMALITTGIILRTKSHFRLEEYSPQENNKYEIPMSESTKISEESAPLLDESEFEPKLEAENVT